MDQKAWKQEMQVAKLLEEVEAIAGEFNKKAESLNVSLWGTALTYARSSSRDYVTHMMHETVTAARKQTPQLQPRCCPPAMS